MLTKTKYHHLYVFLLLVLPLLLPACGQVSLMVETDEPVLTEIQPTPNLIETQIDTSSPEENVPTLDVRESINEGSKYWVEIQDTVFGTRIAVPCFWEVHGPSEIPENYSSLSYPLQNYSDAYAQSFPRGEGIFDNGGIKIDVGYMRGSSWGLAPGTGLMDFVKRLYSNDSETNVISTVETTINNQQALFVTTESTYGIGQFYLFIVNADMYLLFSSSPEAFENRDVQAILNSIAVSPEVSVNMPGIFPNSLPKGLNAACLGETTENPQFTETLEESNQLLCKQITPVELGIVACNIQDGIISRNTAPLLSYMTDPFSIGYWGSEWRDDTPRSILEEVQMYRLPSDGSLPLTFTVDRSTFPPLAGQNVDAMFGPDINIAMVIYSEGWGTDGKGAALIFITQDVTGAYVWSGLLVSFTHFDKISTGTTACGPASYEFLDYGVQIVEESLQTKDISIIEYWNVIPNPFLISYWGVEATNKTPQEVITEFNSILLPIKTRELSFLSSPGDYPPLSGHAPETLLGENITLARIIYSEGWGSDGNGAALLFFAQDECGGYYWHGIVFSPVHFDK